MPYEWSKPPSEFDRWLEQGQRNGWLKQFCTSHEWLQLMTRPERDIWNVEADVCTLRWIVENADNPSVGEA